MNDPKFLAIIPVRGGSKRLPGKNIRPLAGRPLLAYSIILGRACSHVGEVIVSSDDDEILSAAQAFGARAVRRPAEISNDVAPTISAMQHVLQVAEASGRKFDHVMLLQATCPLRRLADVNRHVEHYLAADADSALSVTELHLKVGRKDIEGWFVPQYQVGVRKQDVEAVYQENGALYLTKAHLIRQGVLLGPRTLTLQMPPEAGMASIDYEFDFQLAEALYSQLDFEREFGHLVRAGAAA